MSHDTPDQLYASTNYHLSKPIVLVGMMGVGKTSTGRRLAKHLDVNFTDADEAISEAAGMSVPEIFNNLGEAAFRDGEKKVILRLLEDAPGIIATGGGAFMTQETREAILEKAVAVWLDAPLDILVERTSRKNTRPLLAQAADPRAKLAELKVVRDPVYHQAHVHVTSTDQSWSALINEILEACAPYFSKDAS